MIYVFRLVDSLEGADLSKARAGDIYVLPNGDAFQFGANQLGGIWSGLGNFFENNAVALIQTGIGVASGLANSGAANAGQAQQIAQQAIAVVEQIKNEVAAIPAGFTRWSQRDAFRAKTQQVIDAVEAATSQFSKENDRNILRAAKARCWQIVGEMNTLIDTPAAGLAYASETQPAGQQQPTTPTGQQPTVLGTIPPATIPQTSGFGIDTQTLLIGGVALAVIFYFLK